MAFRVRFQPESGSGLGVFGAFPNVCANCLGRRESRRKGSGNRRSGSRAFLKGSGKLPDVWGMLPDGSSVLPEG
jgi:hypothetical protein